MRKKYLNIYLAFLAIVFIVPQAQAQYANTKVKSKYQLYTDSLKAVDYNYVFPILGQQAYKKGFDIPYPIGIMGNYMWIDQGLTFDNMQLGLTTDSLDIPLTPVDFIQFGDNRNTSYTVNVRPDIWIFPFLDVYGIFGSGNSHTEVNLVAPISLTSIVDQRINTAGFGVLTAFGVGPVWVSVDANWTWNKPELLDQAVRVNVLGLRLGHTFTFKNHPERNVAIWAGTMRAKMGSNTSGQIRLGDAISVEDMNAKGQEVLDLYEQLPPGEKLKPKNLLMKSIGERMVESDGDAVIKYAMEKQVAEMWNGVFGAQFQFNKHWMLRAEAGLIGDRRSYLVSLNYRFLGF